MALKEFVKGIFKSSNKVVNEQQFLENAENAYMQLDKLKNQAGKYDRTAKVVGQLEKQGEVLGKKISDYNSNFSPKKEGKLKAELTKAYTAISKTMTQATTQIGEAKSFARGQTVGKILKSKLFIIPTALVAATVVAAKIISNKNKRDRAELVENRNQEIAAQRENVAALKGNTLMGLEPAPGDIAAGVLARRNGVAMGTDHSNPNMTAGNFEAVRS